MSLVNSLQVDNFRSLYQFQTELRPFTVLIGRNDAGKTTIVKALQLLLNDDTTQTLNAYDWSRAATSPRYPRQVHVGGQIQTHIGNLRIQRKITLHKEEAAQSVLQVQDGERWRDITPDIAAQLPVLYYLKPRTGALQETFDPQNEHNIFSLVKEWMPQTLSEEKQLHHLMHGYAPKETNLTAYVKFFKDKIYAPLGIAFPSDFPLLQLNPDFRTDARGRLFVRELTHAEADRAVFRLPLDHHGTGLISIVAMIVSVEVLREHHRQNLANKPLIFAIEEPEVHLHAQAQRTFLSYFKRLSQDHQTIISTHSPIFVDRTDPQNVLVVRRTTLKDSDRASKGSNPWKAGTTKVFGSAYRDTWQEVHNTLGIRLSDALMVGEFNLLVEGPTEEVLLPAMAKVWGEQTGNMLDFDRILIIGGKGSGNLPFLARLLLRTGNPTAVLVDGDKAGCDVLTKIQKEEPPIEFSFQLDHKALPPPLNTLSECEFEDFLDPQGLLYIFNRAFAAVPGFDFLPLDFEKFQQEQQHLMGKRYAFGWIATVESLLNHQGEAVGVGRKRSALQVDKRKLAEAAATAILDKTMPLPEFCDALFSQIQCSLQKSSH